jgi:hypothetical protein
VAEPQKARNRAWVARQAGPRELSPESRQVTLLYPDLHVRVWCNAMGINLVAHVDRSDGEGRLHRTEVAKATWRGKPPTEADVVLWAACALSAWLESQILATGEHEAASY